MKINITTRSGLIAFAIVCVAYLVSGYCLGDTLQRKNLAGQFDYYIFAISWQPAFCQLNQKKTECRKKPDISDKDFVIHGLWPTRLDDERHRYGYCGVSKGIVAKDRQRQWCDIAMQPPGEELLKWMPGVSSCLHGHEWVKHGVCSGLASKDYFALAIGLVKDFSQSGFASFVRNNTGRFITKQSLLQQWQNSFGQEGVVAEFVCRTNKQKGRKLLSEIRVVLNKSIETGGSLYAKYENVSLGGNCGKRIYIDAPGYVD